MSHTMNVSRSNVIPDAAIPAILDVNCQMMCSHPQSSSISSVSDSCPPFVPPSSSSSSRLPPLPSTVAQACRVPSSMAQRRSAIRSSDHLAVSYRLPLQMRIFLLPLLFSTNVFMTSGRSSSAALPSGQPSMKQPTRLIRVKKSLFRTDLRLEARLPMGLPAVLRPLPLSIRPRRRSALVRVHGLASVRMLGRIRCRRGARHRASLSGPRQSVWGSRGRPRCVRRRLHLVALAEDETESSGRRWWW
ncbi:hypothetical protein V8E36_009041 [Tilletia maclaganii]